MSELLIKGAAVLDPRTPMRIGDIRINGTLITEVAPNLRSTGETVIDGTDMIAMPGLINAHTHSGQHLDRGVAPNLPLDLWLIWVVYGGIALAPDDSYTLALAGAIEMLESGTTSVLDHAWIDPDAFQEHADAIMAAYADVGLRAGLAPMIQDRDIFESMSFAGITSEPPAAIAEPLDPAALIAEMDRFLSRFDGTEGSGRHPRLVPMVGPSALQRCSDTLLTGLAELTRRHGAPFHTHILETKTQVFAAHARYGGSCLEVLAELGLLDDRTSLAHCVWMDPGEFGAVRDAGVTVVHNPISNLRCGSGLLPLADLLDGGVNVAIGADGAASNDNQNMFEAMKFATLAQTLHGSHRRWPRAEQVWSACLAGGAKALGQTVGMIAPGATADLVLLDTERHVPLDKESLVNSLVMAEHGESVQTVIVGGEIAVEDGHVSRVDRRLARRRARELQLRIHAALPARRATYDRYSDMLTEVHEHAMAAPLPIQRLAQVTPAFDTGTESWS